MIAQLLSIMSQADASVIMQGFLAIITSALWMRIEHRLTKIETNCMRCNYRKGESDE